MKKHVGKAYFFNTYPSSFIKIKYLAACRGRYWLTVVGIPYAFL